MPGGMDMQPEPSTTEFPTRFERPATRTLTLGQSPTADPLRRAEPDTDEYERLSGLAYDAMDAI